MFSMSLSESAVNAWKAFLDRPSPDGIKLEANTRKGLLAVFTDKGRSMEDSPIVRGDKPKYFERWWRNNLTASKVGDECSEVNLLEWLDSFGGGEVVESANCMAFKAVLVSHGVSNASSVALELEAVMGVRNRAAEHEESTSPFAAWAINCCEWLVDDKTLAMLRSMMNAAVSVSSAGISKYTSVNIMSLPRYYEIRKKGSMSMTLDQALCDPTGGKWLSYTLLVTELFTSHGYYGASARWMRFVAYSQQKFPYDVRGQLSYVRHFFFEECIGRGLPTDLGLESVECARRASTSVSAAAREAAFVAQCVPVGPFAQQAAATQSAAPEMTLGFSSLEMPSTVEPSQHMLEALIRKVVAESGAPSTPQEPTITEMKCLCGASHDPRTCTWMQQGLSLKREFEAKQAREAQARRAAAAKVRVAAEAAAKE